VLTLPFAKSASILKKEYASFTKLLPLHALNSVLRFYAALKVAEELVKNKVKTREELTALRHAQPVKMGRDGRVTPSEALTLAVAENVFGLKLNPSRGGLTAG